MLKRTMWIHFRQTGLAALVLAALPALADTQFRVRPMNRGDVPLGKGQCDIRLQVDNEVEVAVQADLVSIRTISGREARDDGSECTEPMPGRELRGFSFDVKDRRDAIRLVEPPSRKNNFTAIVRIRDSSGSEGRYHFRLTWEMTGFTGSPGPARNRPFDRGGGLAWNNVEHYTGRGHGVAQASGSGTQRLLEATVDVDRGGRVLVSFRTEGGRPLTFSGIVMGRDRDVLKADVATDDRLRLRGPMYLTVDARGKVYRVSLNAGNGQDSLQVDWQGR